MANLATYSRLRWGEITVLTASQVGTDTRVVTVDRKIAEHLYLETPRTANNGAPSTPPFTPSATPSPTTSPPAPRKQVPNKNTAPTRSR